MIWSLQPIRDLRQSAGAASIPRTRDLRLEYPALTDAAIISYLGVAGLLDADNIRMRLIAQGTPCA